MVDRPAPPLNFFGRGADNDAFASEVGFFSDNPEDDTETSAVTFSIGCGEAEVITSSVIVEASARSLFLSPLRDFTFETICPLMLGCCPRVAGSDPCYEPQAGHSGLMFC